MSDSNASKFSWLFLPGSRGQRARYDQVVLESDNFVVLPSLGSIVPGWLLLIPKFPVVRFADIATCYHSEFERILSAVQGAVAGRFGAPFVFEHGGHRGSRVSCGVDQAHMHIVPLSFDLVSAATSDTTYQWVSLDHYSTPSQLSFQGEYLFVTSNERTAFAEVTTPISQWFRKIIAKHADCREMWNYRTHPFTDNIELTLSRMT